LNGLQSNAGACLRFNAAKARCKPGKMQSKVNKQTKNAPSRGETASNNLDDPARTGGAQQRKQQK